MEISDFIRIKKNVDQIIKIELSGNPQKQIIEYIEMLEMELIKKDVEVERPEIELNLEENDSEYYIGTQYTTKDLENECYAFFLKAGLQINLNDLNPSEYKSHMKKAYNRIKQRRYQRIKQLKQK
jgi:hypothetical protein